MATIIWSAGIPSLGKSPNRRYIAAIEVMEMYVCHSHILLNRHDWYKKKKVLVDDKLDMNHHLIIRPHNRSRTSSMPNHSNLSVNAFPCCHTYSGYSPLKRKKRSCYALLPPNHMWLKLLLSGLFGYVLDYTLTHHNDNDNGVIDIGYKRCSLLWDLKRVRQVKLVYFNH
jgi:hypothetical protein